MRNQGTDTHRNRTFIYGKNIYIHTYIYIYVHLHTYIHYITTVHTYTYVRIYIHTYIYSIYIEVCSIRNISQTTKSAINTVNTKLILANYYKAEQYLKIATKRDAKMTVTDISVNNHRSQ